MRRLLVIAALAAGCKEEVPDPAPTPRASPEPAYKVPAPPTAAEPVPPPVDAAPPPPAPPVWRVEDVSLVRWSANAWSARVHFWVTQLRTPPAGFSLTQKLACRRGAIVWANAGAVGMPTGLVDGERGNSFGDHFIYSELPEVPETCSVIFYENGDPAREVGAFCMDLSKDGAKATVTPGRCPAIVEAPLPTE